MREDKMVGGHHRLNGHEFEQVLGDGEGQGSLVCCRPQGCKESYTTEGLNNNSARYRTTDPGYPTIPCQKKCQKTTSRHIIFRL